MASVASEKPYLTPNEAAALLMVAPATLRVWADKGLLKAHTTAGGHRRFLREDLDSFQRARGHDHGHSGAALRILIVDDEASLTRYLSAFLKDIAGTASASDGFSAGQLVHTFRPDVVLLDLMMGGLDGFQVCRQIKSDPTTRHIRVIAITGYPSTENIERILAAGAEICLPKPLDEEKLLALLEPLRRERQP
ncbi:MAG: response regulator [Pseudomonadota bacterium]|nr:response regulator [Pseudomonadota bacterium]MDP1903205.1 response regulator [Pseudomonadota bacterium]MDP2354420.1 response regulator [Pseudomonadota bacterium]